ncbi:MAG: glycosyltransferase family 4 protein [Methylocella sp.]
MRILIAHNRYQQRGGEDVVVENETLLLRKLGHNVENFIVTNDEIVGFWNKAAAAIQVLDNPAVTRAFDHSIAAFDPHIVHFHNYFPRLTPSAVERSLIRGIPTLQTLHNFRLICAAGTFLREENICEDCLDTYWRLAAVRHACYRGSRAGSFFVGRVGRAYRQLYTRYQRHLTLIALTEFARAQMSRDGYDPSRIVVKGNSAPDVGLGHRCRDRRIVFVGRLTKEKGADFLLRVAHRIDAEFEIIGDGPERERLCATAPPNVSIRGWLEHDSVIERIKGATAVAMPSRWYEGFPMVLAETLSAGVPVLASRLGALAEIIEDGRSGMTLPVDDETSWSAALRRILDDCAWSAQLREGARRTYDEKYNERVNGEKLIGIYEKAIDRATTPGPTGGNYA